jgi:hypothetical protein
MADDFRKSSFIAVKVFVKGSNSTAAAYWLVARRRGRVLAFADARNLEL